MYPGGPLDARFWVSPETAATLAWESEVILLIQTVADSVATEAPKPDPASPKFNRRANNSFCYKQLKIAGSVLRQGSFSVTLSDSRCPTSRFSFRFNSLSIGPVGLYSTQKPPNRETHVDVPHGDFADSAKWKRCLQFRLQEPRQGPAAKSPSHLQEGA